MSKITAEVRELAEAIREAMEVPVPAHRDDWNRYTQILMLRAATVHGALGSLLDSEGMCTPKSAATTIRSYIATPAVDYEPIKSAQATGPPS